MESVIAQSVITQIMRDPFQLVLPLALLIGTVVAGLILRRVLFHIVREWAAHTESQLDILITGSLGGPIVLWSLILGFHLATQNSKIPRHYLHYVSITLQALWILSLTIAMSRLAGSAVRFYGGRVAGVQAVTSLTQKLVQLVVVALGLVWILKVVFDLSLTPILTTLGVGGIAFALALQDTLSNLFAGFYVSISRLVRIGDYLKLNTGEEGYVTDINWRCTTLRGISNNLVVIPEQQAGAGDLYELPSAGPAHDGEHFVRRGLRIGYRSRRGRTARRGQFGGGARQRVCCRNPLLTSDSRPVPATGRSGSR